MRVFAALAAVMLLAGCDDQTAAKQAKAAGSFASVDSAEAFVKTGSGFDYRYAFRLTGDRVKAVLQSNADGCDKLGPARCRITGMRYSVDSGNRTRAVLTFTIDPAIARSFGEAAVRTLQSVDGVLVDSEISGADATTNARTLAIISRLRDRLKSAQNQAAGGDPAARAQVARIQSALDTIAESEAGQGQTLATAPVLITYESSNALTGLGSADANFRSAGQSLENSVSRVLVMLAAVGPWLLVLIALIFVLRLAVHGIGGSSAEPEPRDDDHEARDDRRHDNRNLIQRWFNRDEDAREPEYQPHG